jgi:hypothetical protein
MTYVTSLSKLHITIYKQFIASPVDPYIHWVCYGRYVETAYTFSGTPEGMPPTDVPGDYKQWLLTQGNIDPYLRKVLRFKSYSP